MYLNGEKIETKIELHNLDRIAVSFNTIFLFKNPLRPSPPRNYEGSNEVDWEEAQKEISNELLQYNFKPEESIKNQSKYIEIENHVKKMENEYEDKILQMQKQHEMKMKDL